MSRLWIGFGVICLGIVGVLAPAAGAQTDVGLSFYGAFSGSTNAAGYKVSPANAAGGMVELRHLANPIFGFEGTYSFNRANQSYKTSTSCGLPCGTISAATVKANAHEVTLDWVPSVKVANFRPFGVLGVGALINVPDSGATTLETKTDTKAVYVYGAGLDWGVLPHLGVRFQYRGNLYKVPDVTSLYTSSDKFRQTAEPMIGVYFSL